MFPIKVLLFWNILTILLFIFSPFEWPIAIENYILLLIFLGICLFFLRLGYLVGLKNSFKLNYKPPTNLLSKWFTISLLLKLVWTLPSYCDRLGLDLLDFKAMFLRLAIGFTNFGESYAYRSMIVFEKTGLLMFITKQILYAITSLTIPLGIILWSKLNITKKTIIVAFIIIDVLYWMGIGTNVGVVNNFLTIFFMIALTHPKLTDFSKLKLKYKIYIGSILFLILSLFSLNISQRHDYNTNGKYDLYEIKIGKVRINKDCLLFNITNPSLHGTIISTSTYLNQGYYHLALAFDEKFEWTYGLGNNYTMLGISKKIAGENLMPRTYISKLEKKGVDPFVNWHSAYLWFANDLTFFGVPVLIFFIGLLFAVSWKSTIKLNDPFAPVIFIFCLVEIFFLCANNQVLSFSFYPFHILLLLWILVRFKYAKKSISPDISC